MPDRLNPAYSSQNARFGRPAKGDALAAPREQTAEWQQTCSGTKQTLCAGESLMTASSTSTFAYQYVSNPVAEVINQHNGVAHVIDMPLVVPCAGAAHEQRGCSACSAQASTGRGSPPGEISLRSSLYI